MPLWGGGLTRSGQILFIFAFDLELIQLLEFTKLEQKRMNLSLSIAGCRPTIKLVQIKKYQ